MRTEHKHKNKNNSLTLTHIHPFIEYTLTAPIEKKSPPKLSRSIASAFKFKAKRVDQF